MIPSVRSSAVIDDAELLSRLRRGEDAAYEILVRTYSGRLLAVTRRILRSEDEAREAVHEAFVQAFRHLSQFEEQALVSTWLHRIAVNTALMRLRKRRRKPEEPLDPLLPTYQDDGHHVEQFTAWAEPVDEAIERRRVQEQVRRCIDQLPESYRTVLLLRDIEEMGTADAAAMLGISENAVKMRLHRARQALRTLVDPHFRSSTGLGTGGRPQ